MQTINTAFAALSTAVFKANAVAIAMVLLLGLDIKIDPPTATIIVAIIVAISSLWQARMLSKVHTLVNSNFTEQKQLSTRLEAALKTSQDLNMHLQRELDAQKTGAPGPQGHVGMQGPAGPTGAAGFYAKDTP